MTYKISIKIVKNIYYEPNKIRWKPSPKGGEEKLTNLPLQKKSAYTHVPTERQIYEYT